MNGECRHPGGRAGKVSRHAMPHDAIHYTSNNALCHMVSLPSEACLSLPVGVPSSIGKGIVGEMGGNKEVGRKGR